LPLSERTSTPVSQSSRALPVTRTGSTVAGGLYGEEYFNHPMPVCAPTAVLPTEATVEAADECEVTRKPTWRFSAGSLPASSVTKRLPETVMFAVLAEKFSQMP